MAYDADDGAITETPRMRKLDAWCAEENRVAASHVDNCTSESESKVNVTCFNSAKADMATA